MELLTEYGREQSTPVAKVKSSKGPNNSILFEVLWGDMLVGSCSSKEEAEVFAENYTLTKQVGRT
jgi:hypothetical protein|tara:strand:+ start:427 stop:621 length:195 start_codon:yes stop_codon:yes gene_type:complete